MAVSLDTSAGQNTQGATTLAPCSLTVASNSNRALIASIGNENTLTVSSIAYTAGSGGAWAKLGSFSSGIREIEIWSSVAPSTGAVTAQATMSGNIGTSLDCNVFHWSLFNVDQTTPCDGYTSGDSVVSLTTTLSSGGMIVGHLWSTGNPGAIINGVEDYAQVFDEFWRAGHNAASGTLNWTTAGTGIMNIANVRQFGAAAANNLIKNAARLAWI